MKVVKFVIYIVVLGLFIGLAVLLYKTYKEVVYAREYIDFLTDSVNDISSNADEINQTLDEIEYSESQSFTTKLEEMQRQYDDSLDTIKSDYSGKYAKRPYQTDGVNSEFESFISKAEELGGAYSEVIASVSNLEEKGIFDEKMSTYAEKADELQQQLVVLGDSLANFVQNYNKFDFDRAKYEFRNL